MAIADEEHRMADPMLAVAPIETRLAQDTVVREHYLHRRTSISYAFGLFDDDELVGVVTFGTPPSRHLQISACKTDPGLVVELNRLWAHDRMPRNTESWFLARALKQLPPLIVVSYADTKFNHFGHMYRAANFYYAGYTDMERKTPRYDYIPWVEGKHTRDAFRNGYAKRVRRLPKAKYWTVTGDRRDRRRLLSLATWPRLDWHVISHARRDHGAAHGRSRVRYVFEAGSKRVMHIARFSPTGEMLWEGLCGRSRLNRSINAPFGLGKRICKDCSRRAA